MYHCRQEFDLAIAQLPAEWKHAVTAIRDLFIDLLLGRCLELSATQARHDRPVFQCFSVALRAVVAGSLGTELDRRDPQSLRFFLRFVVAGRIARPAPLPPSTSGQTSRPAY